MADASASPTVWTQTKSIRLCELIENHPILWDKSHDGYKNSTAKNYIYHTIAIELDTNPIEVKDKWTKVRAQFFREKKKEAMPKGGTSGKQYYVSKWFLMDRLGFIFNSSDVDNISSSNITAQRPTASNISTNNLEDDFSEIAYHLVGEEEIDDNPHEELSVNNNKIVTQEVQVVQPRIRFTQRDRKRTTKDANLNNAVATPTLAQSLSSPSTTPGTIPPERDHWDVFGELVAKKLRAMSKTVSLETQHELNNVLFRFEMKDAGSVLAKVSNKKDRPHD